MGHIYMGVFIVFQPLRLQVTRKEMVQIICQSKLEVLQRRWMIQVSDELYRIFSRILFAPV